MAASESSLSRRKKSPLFRRHSAHFAVNHTWGISLCLLVVIPFYAVNPTDSNILQRFILSYEEPFRKAGAPPQYGKGPWDIAFVSFYTIVLTFMREFIMQEMLHALARLCGMKSRGKQLRFMEQMYTAVYFGLMGPAGLYVLHRSPL